MSDKIDLVLDAVLGLEKRLAAVQREGEERGRTTSATLTVVTKQVQQIGDRVGNLEAWRHEMSRKSSGFNRAVQQHSDTDAKHASDIAAITVALSRNERALSELSKQTAAQTTATGSMTRSVRDAVASLEPSTRKKMIETGLAVMFAISTVVNTYLMSRPTQRAQTMPTTTIEARP